MDTDDRLDLIGCLLNILDMLEVSEFISDSMKRRLADQVALSLAMILEKS